MLQGADLSHHNGAVDLKRAQESGLQFVILKASEGAHTQDAYFKPNAGRAIELGLPWGAYHFFHPEIEGEAQAENFLKAVCWTPSMADGHWIDCEEASATMTRERFDQELCAMLDVLDKEGVRSGDYGSHWFLKTYLGDGYTGRPLWIAAYQKDAPDPGAWNDWRIWQYDQYGTWPGLGQGTCDLDWFNGSLEELKR